MNHFVRSGIFWALITTTMACSGARNLRNLSFQERLEYAQELFDKGKYLDAKTQFQILVLNNPGSSVVDKSQFYLAECYFNLKEYITAAAEYEKLTNLYPRSEYVDDALYKIGLAYFELSPKPALDQKYTYQAIDVFQRFLEEFPESDLVPDVTRKLQQSREKLAEKEYNTGTLYRKLAYYESAIISFDEILTNFYDTIFADRAYYWKAYCLYKTDKLHEARDLLQALISKYPDTSLKEKAIVLAETINSQLEKRKRKPSVKNAANIQQNP